MEASILAIATAVPSYAISQVEIGEKIIEMLAADPHEAKKIRELHQNSAIQTRYAVMDDFTQARSNWKFWGADFPKTIPGTAQRNELYKAEAPKLACEAAVKALNNWGGDPAAITHVISVSCTGMVAPGIEFELVRSLKLKASTQRLGINFMGCFGAFKGLAIAESLAKENPSHRILVVCTELCSLHFQADLTPDNLLGNSLFSDGAAAVIVGSDLQSHETPLWSICHKASLILDNTAEKITWNIGNHGCLMKLSHTVPVLLRRKIAPFVHTLLNSNTSHSDCNWAIHPGGKSIIQAIERALQLNSELTDASWDTLANYGNMSSATILFVLHKLLGQNDRKKWVAGIGFGPGISVEGILLRDES